MADAEAKTNVSYITRLLRAGTTPSGRDLNEKLRMLDGCRWRVLPEGDGLTAIDRRGRELADLYFREDEEERAR